MSSEGEDVLIGESRPMTALRACIARLLQTEASLREGVMPPVLVTGETGVGKELVARALHFGGVRREHRFSRLNCASPDLRCLGCLESGTLFLDEVGEADAATQVRLLDLLEPHRGDRLGATPPHRRDVRIVAATHHDLPRLVRAGRFRADLLYRLRVVGLAVPPLRERGGDIAALASHFLALFAARYGKPRLALGDGALRALLAHSWPGNVRELSNVLEESVLLAAGSPGGGGGVAELIALPRAANLRPRPRNAALSRTRMEAAIAEADGNVTHAARILGISRDTLRYRIRKQAPHGDAARAGDD